MSSSSSFIIAPNAFLDRRVQTYLNLLGYLLIASSIFYLVAANWWMLPKLMKLCIPAFFLLCSASASVYGTSQLIYQQGLDTFSVLMVGLSLAVIGQTYQTGADSYLLFLLWAILSLPWLLRINIGVFTVFCCVIQLALYLYFKQTYLLQEASHLYLLGVNVLLAGCFVWSAQQYPSLRFIFIAAFCLMSLICMLNYISYGDKTHIDYLFSALVLPAVISAYFYFKAQILETSLMAVGLALTLSFWLIAKNEILWSSTGGIVFLAVLLFIGFAVISLGLKRMFPNSKFSVMPLAMGAWLSGVILSLAVLIYNESISIVFGSIFIVLAWFLLKKSSSIFLRQLAYCLWICGQTAVLVYSFILSEKFLLVLLLQSVIVSFTLFAKMHWFKVSLQLLLLYILFILVFIIEDRNPVFLLDALNFFLILIAFFTSYYWQRSSYIYSIALTIIATLIVPTLFRHFNLYQTDAAQLMSAQLWSYLSYYLLPCAVLLVFVSNQTEKLHPLILMALAVLALVFISLGYFEIFVMLVLLAWATVNRYVLIQAISAFALLFWLWMWYYNLNLTLLYKSITIFSSGLAVIMLGWLLSKYHSKQEGII